MGGDELGGQTVAENNHHYPKLHQCATSFLSLPRMYGLHCFSGRSGGFLRSAINLRSTMSSSKKGVVMKRAFALKGF